MTINRSTEEGNDEFFALKRLTLELQGQVPQVRRGSEPPPPLAALPARRACPGVIRRRSGMTFSGARGDYSVRLRPRARCRDLVPRVPLGLCRPSPLAIPRAPG